MRRPGILVEACVDSVDSAVAAQSGGADRVELCDNLYEGGTTPSAGTLAASRARLRIPLFAIIRPRGGDFLFSDAERDAMRHDVVTARDLGADGVVIGALRPDGTVDSDCTRELVEVAGPLSVTFHRALDVCRDPAEALETLIGLGVERVLTSGQAPTALEGAATIAALVRQAQGRIKIVVAGEIDEGNLVQVIAKTGAREVHVRGTSSLHSRMEHRNPGVSMGGSYTPDDYVRPVTDPERIRKIVELSRTQ